MTTFAALTQEVLDHGFADSKYRAYVRGYLNDAQQRIFRETDMRAGLDSQTIATVSGTATVALDSDLARPESVFNTDDKAPLDDMDLREYDDAAAASGKPTRWLIVGSNLTLYPTPDAVYNLRLRYHKLPATMTLDADVPELPSDWHYLLTYWALKRAYSRENDYEAAGYWEGQWDAGLMKLKGELQHDALDPDEPRVVGGYDEPLPANVWY